MRELHVGGQRFPASALMAIITIACLLILLKMAERALASYDMTRQVEAARKELADVKQRNLELQGQIARYRSDHFVEKVAREELNMVRPGDVPVIVLVPTPQATAVGTPRPTATPVVAVPRQWLRHFVDEP